MQVSTRWQRFGTSIFTIMSQKAMAAGALNLAQGFPNFDGPDEVKDAAIAAIKDGLNQYCPSHGLPLMREKLVARQKRCYDISFNPDTETTVFSGATEALFCTLAALFETDDEVLCFEPYYDSYPACLYSSRARLVGVPLTPKTWRLDRQRLKDALNSKTKGILINSPHNPTGMVLNADERKFLADFAIENDLVVVTDEVYEELTFDVDHVPLATLPGMRERTVTISSFSKTFSMTGWKVGYTFAPPEMTKLIRSLHQFTVFCSATPLAAGMIAALDLGDAYFDEFRATYRTRRDRLAEVLRDTGFELTIPEGSYFILANYGQHSDLPDYEFADEMIAKVGVATVPISPFYDDPEAASRLQYLRFAFCKDLAALDEAHTKLSRL